jgi:hypothetical protein
MGFVVVVHANRKSPLVFSSIVDTFSIAIDLKKFDYTFSSYTMEGFGFSFGD